MWYNLDKPRMMSEFWKRRVSPYGQEGDPSATTPMPMDDDYPAPHTGRGALKSVLIWTAAILGVFVLLGAILVVPGLIF